MDDRMVAALDVRSLEQSLELPPDNVPCCASIGIVGEKHIIVRGHGGVSFSTPLIDGHRRL